MKNGLFYQINNKKLDLKVAKVFPQYYKGFVFILNPKHTEFYVHKNEELINTNSIRGGVTESDYSFKFDNNIVMLNAFSNIIAKYDIENNTFIEVDKK